MFKLVIVDDEDEEREGLVEVIPWEEYGIEVAASAWNGVEGYEKICEIQPDIVITDIKMPVMSGIELIRKVQSSLPHVRFVVLTGFGEYEYTSQAMELGIKYYLLKPYGEERLLSVMEKVKEEILESRRNREKEQEQYHEEIRVILPRAKAQFFRSALLTEVVSGQEYRLYRKACRIPDSVRLLSVKAEGEQDVLENFIIQNIAEELLGEEQVILATGMDREVLFLLRDMEFQKIDEAVEKLKKEYARFSSLTLRAAVSERGGFDQLHDLYGKIGELHTLGRMEQYQGLVSDQLLRDSGSMREFMLESERLKEAGTVFSFLLELSILFAKFEIRDCRDRDVWRFLNWLMESLADKEDYLVCQEEKPDRMRVYKTFLHAMYESGRLLRERGDKEGERIEEILLAAYANIDQRKLSLQWLGKHLLYMNEDYLGRLFTRHMKRKFSSFILEIRMETAKRLIQFEPGQTVTNLAQLVGYPPDGQYFRKMFKEYTGCRPSEYRDRVANGREERQEE